MRTASDPVQCAVSEEILVRTDHLLQVGRFMATFAHEINNCLHVISGLAELAQDAPGIPPSVAHKLQRIIEQSNRASGGIRDVVSFARERSNAPGPVELGALATSVLALRNYPLARLGAEVTFDRPAGQTFAVVGSPRELEQLVLALVLNAEQALAQVKTPRRLRVDLHAIDATASLRVTDSGPGLEAPMRESMFEPFRSGPEQTEHAGLGLTAARAIAERHGGQITCENASAGETTFLVQLPMI